MLRLFTLSALVGALVSLSGCAPADSQAALGQCMAEKLDEQAVLSLVGTPESAPGRFSALGCPGGWSYALSPEDNAESLKEFRAQLKKHPAYRKAAYQAAVPATLGAESRARAAEIGLFMEQVAVNRRNHLACKPQDAQAAAVVAQLDQPFVLAALMSHAGVASPELAQKVLVALSVQVQARGAATEAPACDVGDTSGPFLEDAKAFARFYAGQHEWAPGCTVDITDIDFGLRCSPSKK